MDKKPLIPFVPASQSMAELTFKAVALGAVMAVVLGAANAYVGMKDPIEPSVVPVAMR